MKKLISLLAALAVVSTCTMSAFAFSVETTDETGNPTTTDMTVTVVDEPEVYEAVEGVYTVDASVAGTQDQTTILAVKGDVVRLGSIEYIDQSATQSFSFALKNELAAGETVNVLVGGSNGTVYNTGYMQGASESTDPEEPTTYTVSGTVGNVVEQSFIEELSALVEELYGAETVADYVAGYSTTAYLISVDAIESYIAYYSGDADSFEYVQKCDVSAESGMYTFSNVENGEYAIILSRPSALPYMDYVTVDGENATIPTIDLVLGDVEGKIDWAVGGSDALTVLANSTDIESEDFKPSYDILSDYAIGGSDALAIIKNASDITTYGTTLIGEWF